MLAGRLLEDNSEFCAIDNRYAMLRQPPMDVQIFIIATMQ